MDDIQKFDLKLNEDNDLSFGLSIDGTVSDPSLAAPNFRFTIMETGGGKRGWIFPAIKEDNDVVRVRIPAPLKEGFSANKTYQGKLEVIVGSLYFSPAEMMLEFSAPLTIKAEVLNRSTGTNPINKITATVISNNPVAQKSNTQRSGAQKPMVNNTSSKKPYTPIIEEEVDLSENELAEILSVIRERKQPTQNSHAVAPRAVIQNRVQKPAPMSIPTSRQIVETPRATIQQKPQLASKPKHIPTAQEKEDFKNRFMSMFKEALSEVKK